MALVSGESMSSFSERNATPYADLGTAPDDSDDDEYVYVSSLAEQIAHTLMLDDDEEPPSPSQPSPNSSFQPQLQHQGSFWPSTSFLIDQEFEPTSPQMIIPVSNFAAAWRDHGPSEWDCFYTPTLQQASTQLSTLYTTQLELRRNQLGSAASRMECSLPGQQQTSYCMHKQDM